MIKFFFFRWLINEIKVTITRVFQLNWGWKPEILYGVLDFNWTRHGTIPVSLEYQHHNEESLSGLLFSCTPNQGPKMDNSHISVVYNTCHKGRYSTWHWRSLKTKKANSYCEIIMVEQDKVNVILSYSVAFTKKQCRRSQTHISKYILHVYHDDIIRAQFVFARARDKLSKQCISLKTLLIQQHILKA